MTESIPSTFMEIPIRSSLDDGFSLATSQAILPLHSKNSVMLTFRNIPLDHNSNIEAIHLQMYGAVGSEPTENDIRNGNILIQAKIGASIINTEIIWSNELEIDEFERNEVWVTPNLKKMLDEIVSLSSWSYGQDITFILTNRESSDIRIFTYDYSPCFAPTLAIELNI